jgi:hypothetical protein
MTRPAAPTAHRMREKVRGMIRSVWGAGRSAVGSVWDALRARPRVFVGVAVAVFALNLILPLAVLSLVRKPWDYASFNPWLSQLPRWLASPEASWTRKLEFLQNLSLFWFIASSPYDEPEWGFAVGARDLVRWAFVATLFGAYFALWAYVRSRRLSARLGRRGWEGGRPGGVAGALVSTLGLSTAPCSVMGCGAPVLPVLGLAFQGLSSSALVGLATLSSAANLVVEVGMSLVVLGLGWLVGRDEAGRVRAREVGRGEQHHPGPPAGPVGSDAGGRRTA